MEFEPTAEQQEILENVLTGKNGVIDAGAGTGKTSTLEFVSRNISGRGIYVAYNSSVKTEAEGRFPSNVTCKTGHGLAFRTHATPFKDRLFNAPRITGKQSAQILGITEGIGSDESYLSPVQLARLALETVRNWCYSDKDSISTYHVPSQPGTEEYEDAYRFLVKEWADKAWNDISSKGGRLKFEHDHYLKMYALSSPKLSGDFILLDEAQDANPVIAQVVNSQDHMQKIMVGDRCQAIYGWRGAVDAMSTFPADWRSLLQKSFRFGPAVADEANKWLTLLDADIRLEGHEPVGSVVESFEMEKGGAVLCRTNGAVMQAAIEAQGSGKSAAIVGGAGAIKNYAEAALDLMAGKQTWHPELCAFKSWTDVQTYCNEEKDAGTLKVIVKMIDAYGPHRIIEVASGCVTEENADVIVSTAHKAKGREWNQVRIATDFQPVRKEGEPENVAPGRPEMMLAYVAVTRAKKQLDNEGLAWVNQLLDKPGYMEDDYDDIVSHDNEIGGSNVPL